jgi:hypothetical protein
VHQVILPLALVHLAPGQPHRGGGGGINPGKKC